MIKSYVNYKENKINYKEVKEAYQLFYFYTNIHFFSIT